MARLRAETGGRGWLLSVQRWSVASRPPLSSNLGAAALVLITRSRGVQRVAARWPRDEHLWLAITVERGLGVLGCLADGRLLADEPLEVSGDGPVVHCLVRVAGVERKGIGREDVPVFEKADGPSHSISVRIGDKTRIDVRLMDADRFDVEFGPPPITRENEPAVYGGWRLP